MKVRFVPQNIECEIEPGKSVMHVAQDNGLYIKSVCKGVPSCAECRVRVTEGDHNVLPPGSEELSLIGSGHFIDHRRLSCQLHCFGDITIDMSEQIAKEQGLIVGRKKKSALKDDRVEEAVARRSENTVDEETSSDANSDAAHQHAPRPSRDPRDSRDSRETRDTRPQGDRNRGPRGQGGDSRRDGGGARGQQQNRKQGGGQQSRPGRNPNPNSKPGGERQASNDRSPRGPRPPVEGQSADAIAAQGAEGASGENAGSANPNKRRRRRRGKGGGGGGNSGGALQGGGPGGPSGAPPSRPG